MMLPAMKPQQWTQRSGRAPLLDSQCLFSLLLAYFVIHSVLCVVDVCVGVGAERRRPDRRRDWRLSDGGDPGEGCLG